MVAHLVGPGVCLCLGSFVAHVAVCSNWRAGSVEVLAFSHLVEHCSPQLCNTLDKPRLRLLRIVIHSLALSAWLSDSSVLQRVVDLSLQIQHVHVMDCCLMIPSLVDASRHVTQPGVHNP